VTSGFNNIKNEWFNSYANVNDCKCVKKFNDPFKYKCEAFMGRFGNNSCVKSIFHKFVWNKHGCHSFIELFEHWYHVHCFNTNIICLFILFKHECCMSIRVVYTWKSCTWLPYINNAQHLNNASLWNNKFCMHLEWTHEACKFMMLSCYVCFNIY
jgi:hypothetical protein